MSRLVVIPDLIRDRWRSFVPVALDAGFRAAHAVPLRLRGDVLGALNLFRSEAVARAAMDGKAGDPSAYFDYVIQPPPIAQ